ncbi:MAG: HlyD family secretion protein [Rickettsiales endosymbiont of Dermacentor nuttalli]
MVIGARYYESTDDAYLKSDIIIIKLKVTGYIKEIYIRDNQLVKKGDIIACIGNADYQEKVRQKYSIQKFKKQFEIQESLIDEAKANLLAVTQQLQILKSDYLSLKAKIKYSKAALALSKIDLENTEIKAQNSGIITKNAMQVGQLAQPGVALAYLVHNDQIWVEANLKNRAHPKETKSYY